MIVYFFKNLFLCTKKKKMKKTFYFLAICAIALGFTACSDDDDDKPTVEPTTGSMTIDTRAYDKWTYFSFAKGDTVPEPADFKNDKTWDIAFHRWDVRTNGGESGVGEGAAFQTTYESLDVNTWSLSIAQSNFTKDEIIKTYMATPNMYAESDEDQRSDVPANTALGKWMTVTMSSIPPTYAIINNAFVVRTANGSYAAIRFTNYMNDKAERGYVSFDYIYPIE